VLIVVDLVTKIVKMSEIAKQKVLFLCSRVQPFFLFPRWEYSHFNPPTHLKRSYDSRHDRHNPPSCYLNESTSQDKTNDCPPNLGIKYQP
jgi:hypothetical protein